MRIVFMGTPFFAVPTLRALAKQNKVVGVVTQPDRPSGRGGKTNESPVKRTAREYGIAILQPQNMRDKAVIDRLKAWDPAVIVVVAFGKILPKDILQLPPLGCVNVHASLLPRWRGAAPIPAAILAGDAETGVSVMQMDEGMDTGPILTRVHYPITVLTTAKELYENLSELGAVELVRILPSFASGEIQGREQKKGLATYAPQLRKADGEIDWEKPAEQLERQLRAYDPWPGSYSHWKGRRLLIHGGTVTHVQRTPALVFRHDGRLAIGCGEGALLPKRLQIAGRRAATPDEFTRGHPEIFGAHLSAG